MINLNIRAREAFENALRRKKTLPEINHQEDACSLCEEFTEFFRASETTASQHIPKFTEAQEELADIIIACLTELYKRNTKIESLIKAKIKFNESRT